MFLSCHLTGKDFDSEKAIIGVEIYTKGVWRIAVVARGFNGGLGELLKNYGGEIAEDSANNQNNKQNNNSNSSENLKDP